MEYISVIMRQTPKDNIHGLKAIVSLVLGNNEFAVHNVKLIKRAERWFLAMPSEEIPHMPKDRPNHYRDIAHPIGKINRDRIELEVFL